MLYLQRIATILAAAILVAGPMTAQSSLAGADASAPAALRPVERDLSVVVNRSTPVEITRAFKRIAVSQPEIADASPTADNRLYVRGRKIGSTNILVYDDDGRLVEIIDVRVQHDIGAVRADIAALFPGVEVDLRTVASRLHVRGDVPDDAIAAEIMEIAASYAPEAVINALNVNSPQQVMLEVRFVEASREDVKEIGLGSDVSSAGDFIFSTGAGLLSGSTPKTLGAIFANSGDVNIDLFLRALEEKGIIRTLAEPNLVARSGETASFLAGGEFPVPVAADEDRISIEFREFGVSLSFTPTIISGAKMSLEVRPEVSQLDPRNSVRLSDVEIPALSVRRANTIVELADGESFAIAGLIQNTVDSTSVQTPWLGDVPILGALFRSNRFRENETELVIIITPRLVQPAARGRTLSDPLQGREEPSESERLLLGRMHDSDAPPLGTAVKSNISEQTTRRDLGYVPETGGGAP